MRLKLTLVRPGGTNSDLVVTADASVTVGRLASVLVARDPYGEAGSVPVVDPTLLLTTEGGSRSLPVDATLAEAGLRSGCRVTLQPADRHFGQDPRDAEAARLTVISGPDVGMTVPLRAGANEVGRDGASDVVLQDRRVSKRHARITVTDAVDVLDVGSANGLLVGGEQVPRARLTPEDVVTLGNTSFRVVRTARVLADSAGADEPVNRSPWLDARFPEESRSAPEPPPTPDRVRLGLLPLLAPLVVGAVLFAVTRQFLTVLFVALSPLLMLSTYLERRQSSRKEHAAAVEAFRAGLETLGTQVRQQQVVEVAARDREHPSTARAVEAALTRSPLLWSRRTDRRGFLEIRLGLATLPSRVTVEVAPSGRARPDLLAEAEQVRASVSAVAGLPVVAVLSEAGNLGVSGEATRATDAVRALIAQLACLHSPADLVLAAVVPSRSAERWDWLKWLPHTSSEQSPVDAEHVVARPAAATRLVSALEAVVSERLAAGHDAPAGPAVVLLVEDGAPVDRSLLVQLAERGPAVGVHLLWQAERTEELPAPCRTYLQLGATSAVGQVPDGALVLDVVPEALSATEAEVLARRCAPLRDAGAPTDDQSDLPGSVALVRLSGPDSTDPRGVLDRWRTSSSLPDADGRLPRLRREQGLRSTIGVGTAAPFVLDLREHGPHALVGGTTGSGKSEFLQTWVLGMALEHSPARVTFLLVDYKGGSAFAECVDLPHCVGLVTDLSPHLVRRALTSLRAELHHRERILARLKAKDLVTLERSGHPEAPPALVIVVDEFAALAKEVPEFVEGVVDVAQRGRSLGLHLVLATQRPAGVIKDSLRANTNLRVALRVNDVDDSNDVLGSPLAAAFDPGVPGRAAARLGPGKLVPFQTAYVGGRTAATPPPAAVVVEELTLGTPQEWTEPEVGMDDAPVDGPTDLHRSVQAVRAAHEGAGLPAPRRPWLEELAPAYDLARMPQSRDDLSLVFAVRDEPAEQRQVPVAFEPDRDGNMAVFGTGGSGKTTVLRTLGVVAGLSLRGGPCHVYALDFGGRGLQVLQEMDHVGAVISGDDEERVARLLRQLRSALDERALRYGAVSAGSIQQYRELAGRPDEPRLLLLVDNLAAFRTAYESGPQARLFEAFTGLAADGRPFGLHVVVTADRAATVPSSLGSVIQRRLVLRLADDRSDYSMLGVPDGALHAASPPGRGVLGGAEVQVAVLSGSANTAVQAKAVRRLGEDLRSARERPLPAPVGRLPERVRLGDLPREVDGLPVLGVSDDDLQPTPFRPEGSLLVTGMAQSGRTSLLATLALSVSRWRPGAELFCLSTSRSQLHALGLWTEVTTDAEASAVLAKDVLRRWESPGRLSSVVVVEGLPDLLNGPAESAVTDLVKAARGAGCLVVSDAEATQVLLSYPLFMAVRAPRHGFALQPDQSEGDGVFRTPFPRINRAAFPPGRGFYVHKGRALRVQVALPEDEST